MGFLKPINGLFHSAGRQIINGVDKADQKLIRVAMNLMALKTKSPAPIHPKNLVQKQAELQWFNRAITGGPLKVLDLGAGSGGVSVAIAKTGAWVTALERDPKSIEVIKSQRQKLDDPARVEPVEADLENTPYPIESGVYDVVISFNIIEHLYNRSGHLAEINRALKPGGKLVITGPNRATTWKKIRGSFGLSMLADEDHKIEYTRDEFLAELASAGLTRVVFEELVVVDAPISGIIDMLGPISLELWRRTSNLKLWLARKFPKETTGFLLIVEKP